MDGGVREREAADALDRQGALAERRGPGRRAGGNPGRALAGFCGLHLAPCVSVHSVFALPAILLALTPFHSAAKPLPPPVQKQLKTGGFWHRGCPVPLSGLRLLTVSHRGFDGRTHTGQLIVNTRAARPLARVFRRLYGLHFPIRHMRLADFYGPPRGRPPMVT